MGVKGLNVNGRTTNCSLTNEVVSRKGICVPHLQVKSGGNFFLRFIPRKETRLLYEKTKTNDKDVMFMLEASCLVINKKYGAF